MTRVWYCLLLLKVDAADGSVSERSSVCAKVKDSREKDRLLLPTHPCLRFSSKVKNTYQIAYSFCIVPRMLHWCTLLLNGNTILSNCIYWKTPVQKVFCFVFLVSLFPFPFWFVCCFFNPKTKGIDSTRLCNTFDKEDDHRHFSRSSLFSCLFLFFLVRFCF